MATKRISIYYSTLLVKNELPGGAWTLNIVRTDREGQVIDNHISAWRGLPAAKRFAVGYIGKRPKWEINETKTQLKAVTETRVAQ